MRAAAGRTCVPRRRVLIVVENNMVPLDRRVWYEATALRDAGWQVAVICPRAEGSHDAAGAAWYKPVGSAENLDGVTVYRFSLAFAEHGVLDYFREYAKAFLSIALLSWQAWRSERFDILHLCNPPDILFPIGLFYRLLGAKFVFDHHDLFPESVAWRYRGRVGSLLYAASRIAEYLTFRSANVVIATNESYCRVAVERGHVPAANVVLVRNGPKVKDFAPLEALPALKKGFPHMACFVGLMGVEDGIAELIEVIQYVVYELQRRDILFVLIGDGAERTGALDRIRRLSLEAFVEMPGLILDDSVLRQYIATADVLLSPEPLTPMNDSSTFIKIGEYMAMGKPSVAFDLRETRCTAGDAALFILPGDIAAFARAISDLSDHPEKRSRMGTLGLHRARETLAWENQVQNLFHAYEIALDKANDQAAA